MPGRAAPRYLAVAMTSEGSVYVMGIYRERARAEEFAAKVNAEVERRETAEFDAWHQRPYEERDMAPDGYGRVYVLHLHAPRYRQALAFTLTGNPDPQFAKVAAMQEP